MPVASPELQTRLAALRRRLDTAFRPDTAWRGMTGDVPSTGHCAVVSLLVARHLGGALVSATVEGDWHWFNRLFDGDALVDVDATADQFGGSPVAVARAGALYAGATLASWSLVDGETWARAARLAERAGLAEDAAWCRRALERDPAAAAAARAGVRADLLALLAAPTVGDPRFAGWTVRGRIIVDGPESDVGETEAPTVDAPADFLGALDQAEAWMAADGAAWWPVGGGRTIAYYRDPAGGRRLKVFVHHLPPTAS